LWYASEREQTADAEQHDATMSPKYGAHGRSRKALRGLAGLAGHSQQQDRLPASATEWMPSASSDEEPVRAQAPNLVTAMNVFAARAATTALVPPSELTVRS
jgi:hypothetical protein